MTKDVCMLKIYWKILLCGFETSHFFLYCVQMIGGDLTVVVLQCRINWCGFGTTPLMPVYRGQLVAPLSEKKHSPGDTGSLTNTETADSYLVVYRVEHQK